MELREARKIVSDAGVDEGAEDVFGNTLWKWLSGVAFKRWLQRSGIGKPEAIINALAFVVKQQTGRDPL